jgi:hypothetical protein
MPGAALMTWWQNLDTIVKAAMASLFFVGLGATAGAGMANITGSGALEHRITQAELDVAHVRAEVESLNLKVDYLVCVGSAGRQGKSEQDCYEETFMPRRNMR